MRKILYIFLLLLICTNVKAFDESVLVEQNSIQSRIDNLGNKILNSNSLSKRVVFVYDDVSKKNMIKECDTLTKRQVVVYKDDYKYIASDDELAAYLSREIPAAIRSYDGIASGWLSSAKIKAAPKKYELVFDKFAVDYMVKAGYNPLGLITFINKSCPQARQDAVSTKNLTSKRLAHIYEYIYMKYPYFLENNTYQTNEHYQNFLLTSQKNRQMLSDKIRSNNLKKTLKYE
ncbi:MAG: hypothetical protein E7Z89_02620 [Cyanobacteria bacterium SIG28]|nr:hypothetical protein [Cyanobacteria bacterium SIG28]